MSSRFSSSSSSRTHHYSFSQNSPHSVKNTNRFIQPTSSTSSSRLQTVHHPDKTASRPVTQPVLRQVTKGMCQKMAKQQYARDFSKCDVDHTDPANAKCYHDAHQKVSSELRRCEVLPATEKMGK